MSVQQRSYFCPVCQQQRLFTSHGGVNQVFYLLLTLFSCGLWAIVWFIQNVSYTPRYYCSQCGYSDATKYLANPALRSQEAQRNAERPPFQLSSPLVWFSGLDRLHQIWTILGVLFAMGVCVIILGLAVQRLNKQANLQSNANSSSNSTSNSTSNSWSNTDTTTPTNVFRDPSSLSSAENLEEAKKRLKTGDDVDKTFALIHLEKIPKTAKEYSAAKQLIAEIKVYFQRVNQRNEPKTRKEIEDELANLAGEDARLDKALDIYEDYDGQAATQTKLNALKRKAQIEQRRIELERKLKKMP